jgi:hypothetical protein
MGIDVKQYQAPGPVGARFIASRGPIDIIMGPAGSGKTVASCIKGPLTSAAYMPICKDGRVRVKLVCVRDTYRDFARTALASWHEMFPIGHPWQRPEKGYEGGQDRPVKHHLIWEAWRGPEKVIVEFSLETGAIGDNNVMQFVKGYEVSMAWGNEIDLLDPSVPGALFMRTGRYPPVAQIADSELQRVSKDGREAMRKMGITVAADELVLPRMFWGDMNPPDIDHPILKECGYNDKEARNPAYNFFEQPGGLDPLAENRVGRPRSAYEMDLVAMPEHISRRMVHGKAGYAQDGKPIYPEFNDKIHVADQALDPLPNVPLSVGFDAGGSPAGVIGQFLPNGQLRLLDEICAEPGTGVARFAMMTYELLIDRYAGFVFREAFGDPSAFYGADTQNGELAFMQTLGKALSLNIFPTESNEPGLRQDAVRWYLAGVIDQSTPRMIISPRCKKIIGGFAAHYKLTKQASIGGTDKLAAVKNEYSHPHDGLQYLCLGHRGAAGVMEDAAKLGRPDNVMTMQQLRDQRAARHQQPARPGDFNVWDV